MKKPNIKGGFQTRAFRAGGYSILSTVLVIAIAVVINVIASALPARYTQFDTTSTQLFSISQQTEEMTAALDEDVTIYWVVRSGSEDSTIELLLDQYEGMSDYISVVKKDPDVSPGFITEYELENEYTLDNCFVVESAQRYRYIAYDSIYTYDYTNYYTTGTYDVSFAGESALTSAISYVTTAELSKIYTLTGHGEMTMGSDFENALEQANYELGEISLLTENAVPEDADVILIYGPQRDISAEELAMLESYLAAGGNLMLITDPPEEDNPRPNLESLMAQYGMSAVEGIVMEGDYNYYAMGVPYYLLPELDYHTVTSPLIDGDYFVLLPLAQGLQENGTAGEDITVSRLLSTSAKAYSKVAGYALSSYEKEEGDIDGDFALAMIATKTVDENTDTNVLWVGSTSLLDNETNLQVSGGNQDLFLNALGYMTEQEENITIHAKSLSYEYLTMSNFSAALLKLLMLGVIPLGYLLIGVQIYIRRKRR